MIVDEYLTWNFQISQIKNIMSRSSGLLAKLRYYVKPGLLRTVYFAVFNSILRYGIQVWEQNRNQAIKDIEKIQDKTIRILNFKWKNDPVNPLFKNSKIMKMKNILTFNNCLLYMIKLMNICRLTLMIFSPFQKTYTHTIKG